jgi:hypothetical protein
VDSKRGQKDWKGFNLRKYLLLCVLLGIVLLAGLSSRHQPSSQPAQQAPSLTVEKQPVTFAMHMFDPSAPPAEMPPLAAWEGAECDSNFVSNANVKARTEMIDGTHGVVTVTQVKVTLQLAINIWVPEGAAKHVIDHEQGHRQISEHYYETADKVAEQIAATYLGKRVSASGADLNAEVYKSLQQMGAEITAEYSRRLNPALAQNRYDDITDHGQNEVSAAEAVAEVLKDFH